VGASATLAFLALFLAAPQRFFFGNRRPREPTFCQPLQVLRGLTRGQVFFLNQGSLTCSRLNCVLSSCPSGASEQEPFSEVQTAEFSICFDCFSVLSICVPRVRGDYKVRQAEPPCLVRLYYLWEVAWYPRGCRLRQINPLPFIP